MSKHLFCSKPDSTPCNTGNKNIESMLIELQLVLSSHYCSTSPALRTRASFYGCKRVLILTDSAGRLLRCPLLEDGHLKNQVCATKHLETLLQ